MPENVERVSPCILPLESIDYLGTSEYLRENLDWEAINWSGVVNFYCTQMILVMSTWFIFGDDWNDAMFITFLVSAMM